MVEFAHAVQQKLNQYKADDATMGEVIIKKKKIVGKYLFFEIF